MKKIGVITFSKSLNYGAFLQAYALQTVLKNMNYSPSLIDYENEIDRRRYALIKTYNAKSIISSIACLPVNIIRRKNFKQSIKLLKYTSLNTSYDIAITGSDQVWNPKLTGNKIEEKFFLSDINAGKKISYAASVANEEVIDQYRNEFIKHLSDLDSISVRESSAKESLSKIIGRDIKLVADPTLLVTRKQWLELLSDKEQDKNNYVFSYFVGGISKKENLALTKACSRLSLRCISYSKIPKEKPLYKHAYTDGPVDFLARLRDAKIVLTSSFHGVALSIVLHKNFYYFMPRADKRSRVDSLLNILGLTDRIIETEADINKINLKDIDYAEPQKKLDALRKDSLDWLKNAIEN